MRKTLSSRLMSCLLIAMLLTSLFAITAMAEGSTATLLSAPANGEKVVIYYPDSSLALGNALSGKKLAAVDASVVDNKLTVTDDMGIFTLIKDEVTSCYYLIDANGKYFTSGATGNSVSLADEASDCALWAFETTQGGFYVKNYAAAYVAGETSKPQYLEYFSGFTTYSLNESKANIYTFALYKVESNVAPDPVDPPSDDEDDVVYSTIADARKGESGAEFNVKGVVTFIDGKNVVVEDETGAINLYLKAVAEVSVGNKIAANGKRGEFSGLQQLTSASVIEVLEENATIPAAKETTLAEVLADAEAETMECHFVSLKGLTLGETDEAKSTTALTDDEGNTINIYRCPALEIEVGAKVDVVALVSDYKGYQLRVTDASAITVANADEDSSEDESSEDESSATTPSEDESSEEKPAKPGDASTVALFAIVALASVAAVVVVAKKRA